VFLDCTKLNIVSVEDGIKEIGSGAFDSCQNLTSINLSDSITTIGAYAFRDCKSLTNIHIPNGLTKIQEGLFAACIRLTDVIIPETVTSIGNLAFYDCYAFDTITIPKSVVTIDPDAFQNAFQQPPFNGITETTGLIIKGYENTAAQFFANSYQIPFILLGIDGTPSLHFSLDTVGTYDFGSRNTYCYMVWTSSNTIPKVSSSNPNVVSVQFEKQAANGGYLFRINRLAQGTAEITTIVGSERISFTAKAGISVKSDTSMPFALKKGATYTFRMTVLSASTAAPQFSVGNGSVFQTQYLKKSGNDYFFKIQAIGNSGSETAVYTKMPSESVVRQCIVRIA